MSKVLRFNYLEVANIGYFLWFIEIIPNLPLEEEKIKQMPSSQMHIIMLKRLGNEITLVL